MNSGFIRSSTEDMFRKKSRFDLRCTTIPDIAYKPIRIGFPSSQGWFSFCRSALHYYWKSKKYHSFTQNNLEPGKGRLPSILPYFLLLTCSDRLLRKTMGIYCLLCCTQKSIKIKNPHVNNCINFAINQKTNKQNPVRPTVNVLILPMLCIIKTISPWNLAFIIIWSTSRL